MPLETGERAPAFRLRGIDNEFWILGEPDRRRCVLLVFLRRDVPACRTLLPFVERLNRRSRTQEAEILGLSLNNQRDTLEFAEDYCFTFPIVVEDGDRATADRYRIREVPTLYLLGPDLKVLDRLVGWSRSSFERIARDFLERSGAHRTGIWEPSDAAPEMDGAVAIGDPRGGAGADRA
jgi:peroxiredoxin